jgi:hypothetical protein
MLLEAWNFLSGQSAGGGRALPKPGNLNLERMACLVLIKIRVGRT